MRTRNRIAPKVAEFCCQIALTHVNSAVFLLKNGGAIQACETVRRSRKSIEGALRHARKRVEREERGESATAHS